MKYLLCLLLIISCSRNPVVQNKPTETTPVVVSVELPKTPTPTMPTKAVSLDLITDTVNGKACTNYSWPNRGKAPVSYIKGMALSYARELCFPSKIVSATSYGPSDKDVLSHYKLTPDSLNLYTLMIGAGMRESSGKYCEGKDASASNTSSTSAEAGMFQTSYNAFASSPELPILFNEYKNNKHNCLDVFKEGIKCSAASLKNYGSGDGLKYQEMAKTCPAFAVQVGAITFRSLYKHYGPLINKAAEARPECKTMLTEVKAVVDANPGICELLK